MLIGAACQRVAARFASHSSSSQAYRVVVHHRRGRRGALGAERQRVGLVPPLAVRPEDGELVLRARHHARHEDLPHAAAAERAHRERPALPVVEVAGHPHAAGVGRPDRERRAGHRPVRRLVRVDVRAERLPQPLVPALADQVQVDLAERRQPPVRVVDQVGLLGPALDPVRHLELVVARRPGHQPGEHAGGVHLAQVVPAVAEDRGDPARVRPQRADDQPAGVGLDRVGTGLQRTAVRGRGDRPGDGRHLVDRVLPLGGR